MLEHTYSPKLFGMLRQENQLSPRARRLAYEAQQDSQKESGKPSIYISSVKKDFMRLCVTVCMCTMYMPSAEKDHGIFLMGS